MRIRTPSYYYYYYYYYRNASELAAQQEWDQEWNQLGLASRLSQQVPTAGESGE